MRMRSMVAGVVLGALVAGQPVAARAASPGADVGFAFAAAGIDILYVPTKFVIAGLGLMTGGLIAVVTGGDTRAAYALWVPTAGGDFMVRPSHLDGTERLQFFGRDYTDHASTISRQSDGSTIYDATYNSM
jgi:hypothetical protein